MTEMVRCDVKACENGEVWTECCNGSGGCSCEGKQVFFGKCAACNGAGQRLATRNVDAQVNLNAIRSYARAFGGYIGNPHGRLR